MRDLVNGRGRHRRIARLYSRTEALLIVFACCWLVALIAAIASAFGGAAR